MFSITKKKGTGRTTRMMEEAGRCAREGRKVCVVAASQRDVQRLRREHPECVRLGVTFVPCGALSFWDWRQATVDGFFGSEGVVLFDHFAIECSFGRLLEMWHRFDEERDG